MRYESPSSARAEQTAGKGIAVAINGVIYRDHWEQPIPEAAEVVLLTRIAGG